MLAIMEAPAVGSVVRLRPSPAPPRVVVTRPPAVVAGLQVARSMGSWAMLL